MRGKVSCPSCVCGGWAARTSGETFPTGMRRGRSPFSRATATSPCRFEPMKAGAVEFLTKPFRQQDLLDAIRSAIERDRAASQERQGLTELPRRGAPLTPRQRGRLGGVRPGLLHKAIARAVVTNDGT